MNAEKAAIVLQRLAEGMSLRKAAVEAGTSHPRFLEWCSEDPALADQYARARATGADAEFEDLNDAIEEEPERTPAGTIDAAWVAWKRVQIDTKKWSLGKKAPKKYGEKIDHSVTGDLTINWPVPASRVVR